MTINVCVAGATGWTGRAVAEGVMSAEDLVLRALTAYRLAAPSSAR